MSGRATYSGPKARACDQLVVHTSCQGRLSDLTILLGLHPCTVCFQVVEILKSTIFEARHSSSTATLSASMRLYRLATGAFQPQPPGLVSSKLRIPEASQILTTISLTAFTSSKLEPVARQPLKCPFSCGLTFRTDLVRQANSRNKYSYVLWYERCYENIAALSRTQNTCIAQYVSIHQPGRDSKIFGPASIHLRHYTLSDLAIYQVKMPLTAMKYG